MPDANYFLQMFAYTLKISSLLLVTCFCSFTTDIQIRDVFMLKEKKGTKSMWSYLRFPFLYKFD